MVFNSLAFMAFFAIVRVLHSLPFAIFALLLIGALEWHWRAYGVTPSYRNSNGEWAQQRRRIDHGEGGKTVLLGSSRVLFDVQLPVWQTIAGERPIQLAMEGITPLPMLEDLAADPNFTGRVLVGVAPDIFFTGFAYRGDVLPYARKQTPSQRIGNWLSMRFIEPYLAFEEKTLPRARTWDVLLDRTHASGIHFKDYPQLQGSDHPEWSHLSAPEAKRFTAALVPIVESYFQEPPMPDLQAGVAAQRDQGH